MPSGRAFQWFTRIIESQVVASGGQFCVDLLVNLSDVNTKGATVTRIIYKLITRADTANQDTHTYHGIAVVNADAASAGAFPDADIETDNVRWLVRGMHFNATTALDQSSNYLTSMTEKDLRAQIKFRSEQEELTFIVDHSSGGGILLDLMIRVLVRLP